MNYHSKYIGYFNDYFSNHLIKIRKYIKYGDSVHISCYVYYFLLDI